MLLALKCYNTFNPQIEHGLSTLLWQETVWCGVGITKIILTCESNETNIYLLVRAKCVRCNLVVQAEQSSLDTFLTKVVKRCGESKFGY